MGGNGVGPTHMTTTLTSFNVSAIQNCQNPDSPEQPHLAPLNATEDIMDRHELIQQVMQLDKKPQGAVTGRFED